jgi:hypothetical protein
MPWDNTGKSPTASEKESCGAVLLLEKHYVSRRLRDEAARFVEGTRRVFRGTAAKVAPDGL